MMIDTPAAFGTIRRQSMENGGAILTRFLQFFSLSSVVLLAHLPTAAQASYQTRCASCHVASNVPEVNFLPNGTGSSGSIRAANNRAYLDTKVAAFMGNFATLAEPTGLVSLPAAERDAIVAEIGNSLSVAAPVFTSAVAPGGTATVFYSHTFTASGAPTLVGNAGLSSPFTLNSGSLPPGLILTGATGVLSGTPTTGGTYTGTIRASNNVGTAPTQPFTITIAKLNQTISFGAQSPATRSYAAGLSFALNPAATGGPLVGAITYFTNNSQICTITGTTITVGPIAGTCTVTATQNGDAAYNSISTAQNIVINPSPPTAPGNANVVPGSMKATFTFSVPSSNGGSAITGYRAACNPGNIFVVGAGSPIVLNGLANLTAYDCTVSAINVAGSTPSATLMVTPNTDPVPPVFTSANSLGFIVGSFGSLTVSAAGTPTPTLSLNSTLPNGVTFNSGTGALAGTPILGTVGTYALTLIASNGSLPNAAQPFTLTVAKTSQTITFPPIANQTLGGAQVPISAIASSGLAVTFSSLTLGACNVSGSNISLNSTGLCIIAANQAGDGNYSAALQVTQSFFINFGSGNAGSGNNFWVNGNFPQFQPCRNCHTFSPSGPVLNAANTPNLIAFVFNINFLGQHSPPPGPSPQQQQDLAAYIATFVPATNPVNRAVTFNQTASITIPNLFIGTGTLTSISLVTPPSKGSVSFSGPNAIYTPFPDRTGSDGFSFRAVGSFGQTATRTATVVIGNPPFPVVVSAGTVSGVTGTAFSYQITATNTPQSYGAAGLPPGLAVNTSSGQIYGIPTALGSYPGIVSATNAGGTGPLAVTFNISGLQLAVTRPGTGAGAVVSSPAGINCGVACAFGFNFGTVITLTASPSVGSVFTGWSGGGCTGSGTCTVTLNAATTVTATFTLITPPNTPTAVTATPGNASASVVFTPPGFNGGSAITGYTATCGTSAASGAGPPLVVNGLANGVAVNCSVVATNIQGNSASSAPVSVTPRTVPDAPTGVTATPGNNQATVSFTAPASNGGSTISGYTATCGIRTATGAVSPIVVTGLVNGATVNCAVVATNIAGNSAPSASVPVTPRTVPSAPTLPVATAYDSRAIVDFVPSSSDGGSPITGYTVSCNPGAVTANGATSPITINGLTNGTSYTCAVLANNAAGSTPSTSFAFIPAIKTGTALWSGICASCHTPVPSGAQLNAAGPSPAVINYVIANPPMGGNPLLIALTPAERAQIIAYIAAQLPSAAETIAFNVPKSINVGNRITTGGVAFDRVEAGATLPLHGTLSAFTGTTATYTPTAGYVGTDTFTVVGAHDSAPAFLGSEIAINVNVLPPLSPVISSVTTASGANGIAFNYQITASNAPTSFGAGVLPAGLTVNPLTGAITGTPTVGGSFSVTISATNAGGTGSATLTINLSAANQTIAFAPQTVSTRAYAAAPGNTFAIAPLATASSGLAVAYSSLTPGVCTAGSATVTMVGAGNCRIAANQSGSANFNVAPEVTQDVAITAVVPGAPTIGAATPGNLQATIAFTAPIDSGGSAITGYTATCAPSGTGGNLVSPIVVGGLTNGTTYTCSVRASNVAGSGPASATVAVTPVPTPTAPIITSANATIFTVNTAGSFNVIANGNPTPTTSLTGALPSGVAFNAGVLSGTPALGTVGAYAVTLGAANNAGNASQAFTLTVAKTTQTISFTGPGTQNFSAASVPLSATSSAGLAVTFLSNTPGVCTISGANAVLAGVGTCNITAQQLGDANYNAATGVSQGFSIVQGAQTIAFGAQVSPRAYVAGGTFGLAPLASASSGLAVAYSSLTPSVCTIGGTTVAILRAGQCTIAADQTGNGNVSAAAQVSQTITITASVPGAPTIGGATAGDGKAFIGFTVPANDGGSAITTYTATCGGITGSGSASPVTVSGLANGVATTCSVTATNGIGTSAASGTVGVTPNPLPGAAIWASKCASCHGLAPVGTRLNVGGSTSAVLAYAITNQVTMNSLPSLGLATGFPDADRIAVAEYVRDFIPSVAVSTPLNTTVDINVIGQIFINTPITAFTGLQVVAVPTNGTLSAFSGTSVSYTPNTGFVGTDTFTYRGTQAGLSGDPRTVTVTVSQGAPVVTSAVTASGVINQPFGYQIIATNAPTGYAASGLPATLTINPTTGLISGTPVASGTINATIFATNAGGTGSGPLAITINLIAQTINFGAQASPQSFGVGGTFAIAPLATGGASGNPVTYSSATPGVCTAGGTTVSMLAAGVCTIAADQGGNASYNAAARVTQNVTINPVVPGAPTIGAATPGDGSATVAFIAPTFNGGAAITSYTLRCIGPNTVLASGGASPLTANGLTNGAGYACNVFATNAAGNSANSGTVNVTPSALPPLALAGVVSRKVHGSAGTFDVAINAATPIGAMVDVEPRAIGPGHALVFTFNNPIGVAGGANVVDSLGAAVGAATSTASGNDVVVTLTGIPDNTRVTVSLTGVNASATPFAASLGFLIGDVNNTRSVNSSDISGVKARSGQTTNASNFMFDVNASGTVNSSDISAVKARSGVTLAP